MKELTPLMKERLKKIEALREKNPEIKNSEIQQRLGIAPSVYLEIMRRSGSHNVIRKKRKPPAQQFVDISPSEVPSKHIVCLVGSVDDIAKVIKAIQ